MNLYLRLLGYIRPYWVSFAITLVAMFVVSVGNLIPTIIGGSVIDQIVAHGDVSQLHWAALILIGIHLIKSIGMMIAEWLSHEIAEHIIFDMRTQTYSHLQKLSYRFHKDNSTGELMSRVVNDIDALRDMLAHSPNMLFVNLLTFCRHRSRFIQQKLAACAGCHGSDSIHRVSHGEVRGETPPDL